MHQSIRSAKGPIRSNITIPSSNALTYRALLLAALAEGVSELSEIKISKELRVFEKALLQLGVVSQIDEKTRSCVIAGTNGQFLKKQATLWCEDSKSIARFLLSACAVTSGVFYFDGSRHLRKQSLNQLIHLLKSQGIQFIPNDTQKLPLTLIGAESLEGGEMTLDHAISSQVISALLMISPYARSPFNFNISDITNQSNIHMTCALMTHYGVAVHRHNETQLIISASQRYRARDYTVEPDFAIAVYFFAAAAVTGGEITIQRVKYTESKQTDVNFISVLEKMGCRVHETNLGLSLQGPDELQGIEISMKKFSDTFLALAAIAPFAKSPIRISHLGDIKQKELKRMATMKMHLINMGIHVEIGENWIKIFPGTPKPGIIDSHQDPRIAMAFSLIGLKVPGIIIQQAECVNKVYPDFYAAWDRLSEEVNISA